MRIGEIIKRYRDEHSLSMRDFGKKAEISASYVAKLESDIENKSTLTITKIGSIARAMGLTADQLLEQMDNTTLKARQIPKNIFVPKFKKVPKLGEIPCGKPIYANEEYGEFGEIEESVNADFCLTAKGDSMTGARIHDGDLVFCRNTEMVDNGQIAAVIIEDSATLKRFYYYPEKDLVILRAENPDYEDQIYSGEELNQIHVIGQAVAFQSYVK